MGLGHQLLGVTAAVDSSLVGDALRTGKPVSVADLSSEGRVHATLGELGFGPAAFVPLAGNDRKLGVLVVAGERSAAPFTPAQVALVELFAAQAAVALSYGQARAELERMERVEDRERIARNLHDTVIQRLFATGMVLQATEPLVDQPEARARLQRAVEDLDETIRAIRTTIFELEERRRARPGLRREILDVVSEAATNLEFEPVVRFEGAIDAAVSGEIAAQLLPTLREALSNVVQHARATRVEVTVETSDELTLRVIDDGVGVSGSEASSGHGLRNMGQRAEALGGGLELVANPAGGTALTWRIPTTGG
jgi:signal transduction histidine kinase